MKKPSSTVRWDSVEKKKSLVRVAKKMGYNSINRLVNGLADTVLGQESMEATFRAAAGRGNPRRALALLDKLDKLDARRGGAGTGR